MIAVELEAPDDFEAWRGKARQLAGAGIPPEDVQWREPGGAEDLFAAACGMPPLDASLRPLRASRDFLDLAGSALLHCDPGRFQLAYRLLWRLQQTPRLLDDAADPDVAALRGLARQVRRDVHKMRAFVRFRVMADPDGIDRYVAWFEPEHFIERYNARFFIDRFASQRWSILTPRLSLHWNGEALSEGPCAARGDAPAEDAAEDLWVTYYRSIFNPARLKVGAMLKEMPRRYWKNMPEAREIKDLVAGAQKRESMMIATGADLFGEEAPASLPAIADGIAACRRCPIGCNGTRAVMGEGPPNASLMIVGEQPGDTEESAGRPFIGPAGQLLDHHLHDAGIDRENAYVTNAVKHFKFTPRGKRRLHQSPTAGEIDTCRWWLDSERALIRPKTVLALGASAGRALLGRTPAIGQESGKPIPAADGSMIWLISHPSYLLRLSGEAQERETAKFEENLRSLARLLKRA